MAELTRHFVWMAIKLACAEALLVHRLRIFLLRLTSVCEDFRLDEPMAVCLMAVRCLSPEAWESLNHLSTSPKPKLDRVTPEILAAGIGEVGCYQMTEREWDEIVPPRFLRFMEFFDLREMPKGNGRVRKPVLGMTDAIRRTGVLHDEDPSMTPTCFPFVIPKNSVKCSLILSCVGIHEGLPLKPPKFSLASWELIGRWMAEQDPSRELYGHMWIYRMRFGHSNYHERPAEFLGFMPGRGGAWCHWTGCLSVGLFRLLSARSCWAGLSVASCRRVFIWCII